MVFPVLRLLSSVASLIRCVGKGVIKGLRASHPEANIIAVDYDPGASEVNQLNRIKLMLSTANKNLAKQSL